MKSDFLESSTERVNRYLEKLLAGRYPIGDEKAKKLAEAMAYSLMSKGKRVRPMITLAICQSYGRDDDEALALACTTELIHTASIMLDDLPSMDNAKYRRGKLANHLVFGEATTILASMALWSEALEIISSIESVKINGIVHDFAESVGQGGLVRGQFLDLKAFAEVQTLDDLKECYGFKTASLFKNAARVGAIFCGASQKETEVFEKFGQNFGLIYQIRDDILDVESTAEQIGKDVKIDERNGKATYVSLLGIEKAKIEMNDMIEVINKDLGQLPFDTSVLRNMIKEYVSIG